MKLKATIRIILFPVVLGVLLFIPAGTLQYWEAWVYMSILFVPVLIFVIYLFSKDPEFIERRMRMKEKQDVQNKVVIVISLFVVAVFVTCGLDKRFGWSRLPLLVIIISDIVTLFTYLFVIKVLLENRYASRTVEVEEDHKLITTGTYKIIRHPMYLAVLLMFVSTPFALGSYWASIGNVFIIFPLVVRIVNEEKLLIERLEGYEKYIEEVKYRLIPGIW
jgi:protein-S-isoprenylcysteine O-methyltransferase Ste14